MYIEPNTEIKILKNCPLDTTYEHTLWFSNYVAQYNYFDSLTKYTLSRQSYQRVRRGWMRVEKRAEDLYDCNYLMFRNLAFGNKTFYAFITSVEYVNDVTSEISFEMDVMQTWLFNWDFDECFVVREHSKYDEIGDNLIPEPVNCGNYVNGMPVKTNKFTDWKIVVISTAELQTGVPGLLPAHGGFYAGVYGSCNYNIYPATADGVESVRTLMHNLAILNNTEAVAAVYMLPNAFIPSDPSTIETAIQSKNDAYLRAGDFTVPFKVDGWSQQGDFTLFGGYVPKNKKLYTYPYNYFVCDNNQGQTKEFRYEYFDRSVGLTFNLISDYGLEPSVMCVPMGYMQKRQAVGEITEDMTDSLSITNFPKCTWATTDLGAKLVQSGMSLALLAATRGVSFAWGADGFVTGRQFQGVTPFNATPPMLNGDVANMNVPANRSWAANNIPIDVHPSTRGSATIRMNPADALVAGIIGRDVMNSRITSHVGGGNTSYVADWFDFTFKQVFVDEQFAKCIDDYFSAYGYQTNRLKIPNRSSRPHWNYLRTANCTIKGSIPADDMKKICDIHNAGITYWKNGNEVGNYNLDNSPR